MMDSKFELTEKQRAIVEKFRASAAKSTEKKPLNYDPEKVKAFMEKIKAMANAKK